VYQGRRAGRASTWPPWYGSRMRRLIFTALLGLVIWMLLLLIAAWVGLL
jgi:hypothetical protein